MILNENVAMRLKVDLGQKKAALDIDQDCFVLNNTSHEISQHPGIHHADLTKIVSGQIYNVL